MIISHTHRYIFIKSWKTAGTSIETALSQHCGGSDIVTELGDYWFNRDEQGRWIHKSMNADGFSQHDSAAAVKSKVPLEVWRDYFKFSVARNPWDRVVSLFSWEARNKPALRPVKQWYHRAGFPFNEFRRRALLFREFVKTDWKTNDQFYVQDGKLCVDFVIRYERLADDLDEVCKRVGVPMPNLPHLKSGLRQSGHRYTEYYDAASAAIVAERHQNDIHLLGYKF